MRATPIFQALEALRLVKDDRSKSIPHNVWSQCMQAYHRLNSELEYERIEVPIQQEVA